MSEEIVRKYFKEDLEKISDVFENHDWEISPGNVVDEISEYFKSKLTMLTIKSRSKLIEKCDEIMNNWKREFDIDEGYLITCSFYIKKDEHFITDDDSYPGIPIRLREYLNDTYDKDLRRIMCVLTNENYIELSI